MYSIWLKPLLVRSLSGEKINQAGAAKVLVLYLSVELFPFRVICFALHHLSLGYSASCPSLRKSSCMPLNGATENGERVNTFSQYLSEELLLSHQEDFTVGQKYAPQCNIVVIRIPDPKSYL